VNVVTKGQNLINKQKKVKNVLEGKALKSRTEINPVRPKKILAAVLSINDYKTPKLQPKQHRNVHKNDNYFLTIFL
jgi:hypothetical protein